jgi:hypothetical protein
MAKNDPNEVENQKFGERIDVVDLDGFVWGDWGEAGNQPY